MGRDAGPDLDRAAAWLALRPLIGALAAVLIVAGLAALAYGDSSGASSFAYLAGACLRVGAVLGLVWLAVPDLIQSGRWLRRWLWIGGIGALAAVLLLRMNPKLLPLLFAALLAVALLSRWTWGGTKPTARR